MTDRPRVDPIRGWQAARAQRADGADAQRLLAAAVVDQDDEHQDDEDTATRPPVASLHAGGRPASYQPPTVAEQFGDWARRSINR